MWPHEAARSASAVAAAAATLLLLLLLPLLSLSLLPLLSLSLLPLLSLSLLPLLSLALCPVRAHPGGPPPGARRVCLAVNAGMKSRLSSSGARAPATRASPDGAAGASGPPSCSRAGRRAIASKRLPA